MSILKTLSKVLFWTKEPKLEATVSKKMLKFKSKHCIKRKETKIARARRLLTRDRLFEMYVINGKTQKEIATSYKIDTKSLRTIFESTGIQARRRGRPSKKSIALRTRKLSDTASTNIEGKFKTKV